MVIVSGFEYEGRQRLCGQTDDPGTLYGQELGVSPSV